MDAYRKERARKLNEIVARVREAEDRKEVLQKAIRRLYAQAKKEFGITTERLELEIIKHREYTPTNMYGSKVYFLHMPEDDLLKIGVTRNLSGRVAGLRGSLKRPTVLLGAIDGDNVTERVVHHQFRAHRQHGEFFSWVPISEQVRGMIARNSGLLRENLQ
jgi:hypothetical protein